MKLTSNRTSRTDAGARRRGNESQHGACGADAARRIGRGSLCARRRSLWALLCPRTLIADFLRIELPLRPREAQPARPPSKNRCCLGIRRQQKTYATETYATECCSRSPTRAEARKPVLQKLMLQKPMPIYEHSVTGPGGRKTCTTETCTTESCTDL